MTKILQIPESLQFYFENSQQAGAIQQILEMDSLPLGLTWEEIEHYQMAKISAQTTQFDYWKLMKDLWQLSWGEAVGKKFKEISPEEYEGENSVEYTWENLFYKMFNYENGHLVLGCRANDGEGIYLTFYVESPKFNYEISNNLDLSDYWNKQVDDSRWTKDGLVETNHAEIDVSVLVELAKEAIGKL
jgi:hypothetical protein